MSPRSKRTHWPFRSMAGMMSMGAQSWYDSGVVVVATLPVAGRTRNVLPWNSCERGRPGGGACSRVRENEGDVQAPCGRPPAADFWPPAAGRHRRPKFSRTQPIAWSLRDGTGGETRLPARSPRRIGPWCVCRRERRVVGHDIVRSARSRRTHRHQRPAVHWALPLVI